MECRRTFCASLIILLLLFVSKCAIVAVQHACHAGNCTAINETGAENTTTVTDSPFIFVTPPHTEQSSTTGPKSRAINFTSVERHTENELSTRKTPVKGTSTDLSDVTMDDDEEDSMEESIGKHKDAGNFAGGICVKGGLTYSNGERIEDDCESVCVCTNGKMDCKPRCQTPFIKRGKAIQDPLCTTKPSDDICCIVMVCEADTETEPLEMCVHNNKTYDRGEKFNNGCSEVCTCEAAGKFTCKPRCRPIEKTSDRCVPVQDPEDSCCKKLLCDVSLDDHEHYDKDQDVPKLKLISAKYINASIILLKFDGKIDDQKMAHLQIELSTDKISWKKHKLLPGGFVDADGLKFEYVRFENTDDYIIIQSMEQIPDVDDDPKKNCTYKDKIYKLGDEFYDGCESFCACLKKGVQCLEIQCPTYFGLDIIDSECIDWEVVPEDFVPIPPNCCPDKVRCKNNGSCVYEGVTYRNWDQLPANTTGCDKTCHCEMGKVHCQPTCPPVTATPPATLPCPNHQASLGHLPDDDCCVTWTCSTPDEPPPSIDANMPKKTKPDKNRPIDTDHNVIKKPFASIAPTHSNNVTHSNFAGPLLIYENDKLPTSTNETDLQNLHVDDDEIPKNDRPGSIENVLSNHTQVEQPPPYFGPFETNAPVGKPPDSNKTPAYVGPFNPDFKPSSKPKKGDKTSNNISDEKHKVDRFRPPFAPPNVSQRPQYNTVQKPDEILHIINQHPELANYPSGSVFEIHNYDPNSKYPENPIPRPGQIPGRLPFAPNQIDSGFANVDANYPTAYPIDQLLKQVQNGQIPPGIGRLPVGYGGQYAQNPQYAPHGLQFPFMNGRPQIDPNRTTGFPGFPNIPGTPYQNSPDGINVQQVEAIDGRTVRLVFSVSSLIVGLHGRVEVRYTNKPTDDLDRWDAQIFAPPDDLIATQQLEFDLIGLEPDTEYRLKITILLRDLHNTPTSKILTVRTPAQIGGMPPVIPIEPELAVLEANSTWANVAWRKLDNNELQYVDGVQLRYKEITGKVYAATPLIHRAVTSYLIENLKPNTRYEVGIFFIPFAAQTTELQSNKKINFTTAAHYDPYAFNVTLEIQQIKATSIDVSWSGVPYPEDKYVNIYRAIYQSETGKGDQSTFKIAKRDSPTKTTIMDLKPGTRYRLWLEVYLTSGKIMTSNVQDFVTKPRPVPVVGAGASSKLSSDGDEELQPDYYGSLVVVAILAAVAILSAFILLAMLVRRHAQNKASISNETRISQSAYDNPTYKVEIQQETMDL